MPGNVCSDISISDFFEKHFGVSIVPDMSGRLRRFSLPGKKHSQDGWYVYFQNPSGRDVCIANSWTYSSDNLVWLSGKGAATAEDQDFIRRKTREADEKEKADRARTAMEAAEEYSRLPDAADSHPYLRLKGVHAYPGVSVSEDGNTLYIPLYSPEGEIVSYERIFEDPKEPGRFLKRFKRGGRKSGCFFTIGNPGKGDEAWLCEGYATGASVYAATERPVVIAFDGGNMKAVADALRDRLKLTVVADNDDKGKGTNQGKAYAEKTGLPYKLIPEAGMDANDYAESHGIEALRDFLIPKSSEWIETGDDFISKPSPVRWLIRNMLEERGITMVYGGSNSGKTFVVLDMLLSLSTGQRQWFSHKARKAETLYLCGEGRAGLKARIAAWIQVHGGISTGSFGVGKGPRQLNEESDFAYVMEQIDASGMHPDVIAIDTLSRFFMGNENQAEDMNGFIAALIRLSEKYDAAILLIHHTGVSEEAQTRARGSSALRGAVDTEILIEKNASGSLTLSQTKQRDAELIEPMHLRLRSVEIEGWTDDDGEPVRSAVLESVREDEKRAMDATEELSIVQRAWLEGSHETRLDYPAISIDELRAFMRDKLEWSKDKVKKAFSSDSNSRFIRKLYLSGMIQAMDDLLIITDSIWATCCFLALEGMSKETGAKWCQTVPNLFWHQF